MIKKVSFFVIFLFLNSLIYSQKGKLNQAKQNLNKQQDIQSYVSDSHQDNTTKSFHPFQDLMAQIFWNITYGVAIETIFEKESRMHHASISKYPYIDSKTGNYTYNDSVSVTSRFLVTNSFLRESSSLYGSNFNAKFRFAKRMDIEIGYLELIEKNKNLTDYFSLYSAILNYHRVRTQKLDIWYGIGAMYVSNNVKKAGFAFNAGAEWFIKKPISLYASIKSTVINQDSVTKSKILLKYYQKRMQFFGGYQNFKLTNISVNTVSFGFGYYL
jgi:hypothetical protein